MSVFTWSVRPVASASEPTKDEALTAWIDQSPQCRFCAQKIRVGDRVLGWQAEGGGILAHTKCVAVASRGLLKDIGECLRDHP